MRKALYHVLKTISSPFDLIYRRRIRVLAYHTVPDQALFEQQIKYLQTKYNLITLEDFRKHLFDSKDLPENSVLITFDDGDYSVFEKGLPVLRKYDVPSVLFIIGGLIDSSDSFWWRKVEKNFTDEGKSFSEARSKVRYLKQISNSERINYLSNLKEIEVKQLSSEELVQLRNSKMFIANHTFSHPMINKCTEREVREELRLVKQKFNNWGLSEGYPIFAYPNGNWDLKSEKILKEEGVKMAFLFDHKINRAKIDPLRISRITVDAHLEMNEFRAKLSGIHPLLFDLTRQRN